MIEYDNIYEEDYEILTKIMKEAFNDDTSMHTNLEEDGPSGYDDGSLIRKLNSKENYVTQKVCIDKEIIGAYTVKSYLTKYTIEMLFINPKNKNKGIGYEVWKHIQNRYSSATEWFVETPDYSVRNHYFYTSKCGFKFQKESIYENGEKSVVFTKEISSKK